MERTATHRIVLSIVIILTTQTMAGPARAQLLAPIDGQIAVLDRTVVPAQGRQEALLTVERFGRYAITVSSEQGVALQLIDRMVGPGTIFGAPGERDGRLDVFLDRGEYKIITIGHERAEGDARLAAHSFDETSPNPAEQLVEYKPVQASLHDFEQRSYWLPIKERRWIHIEGAGRTLRDLRLWQDGSWLLEGEPTIEVLDPVVGKPLISCRLALQLEPGLYLLTAYGGLSEPWAEDSDDFPFHLRFGIPKLPMAGRARYEVSPFGIDRWLVPAKANYYRLELPEAKPAALQTTHFNEANAFADFGSTAVIEKNSLEPAVELTDNGSATGFDIVTVKAEARQPYILQHFEAARSYPFTGSGSYWISTTHSGHPEDSVDATAFLAHWHYRGGLQKTPLREQTIPLYLSQGWSTRCNLLDTMTVFLDVKQSGTYAIETRGTEAEFLIEPFFVYRPKEYEAPPFKRGDSTWELDAGYYVLTVNPVLKGIAQFAVKPAGILRDFAEKLGFETTQTEEPVRGSMTFPSVNLVYRDHYTLFINRQPGVRAGVILRSIPLDLREALPLTLQPQKKITIPGLTHEEGKLRAIAKDGTALELSLDGGPWQTEHHVEEGRHKIVVRNQTESTTVLSLSETPTRLELTTPLDRLPVAALDALPDFPVVTEKAPRYFDLERSENKTFLLSALQDGLFRLETTGLLDTSGTVRSRIITSLATSSTGGSGRNFFLHQYLLSGDYQVRVRTNGRSQGHLGLQLEKTEHRDGGILEPGLPARASLEEGDSIVYRFTISEPGEYQLRSFALGRTVRCRLEDGDGWPIITPNIKADIRRHFEPGDYRIVLLPEPVEGRRLTVLEQIEGPSTFTGHGPHPLKLGTTTRHRWFEPEDDALRNPDVWVFTLSGATDVAVSLSSEMQGRLFGEGNPGEITEILPNQNWSGKLEAGRYRIEATCSRLNNMVDYEILVNPTALVAGVERELTLPTTVGVAIAGNDLVEISSFGVVDVRARLEDASGRTVLASDDRPGDWNFNLFGRLGDGQYTLVVQPVDGRPSHTMVRMEVRKQVVHETATLPLELSFKPGIAEHIVPINSMSGEIFLASVTAPETMGLALERATAGGNWETIASESGKQKTIVAPIAGSVFRLRIWSIDRRGGSARIRAVSLFPPEIRESKLRRVARISAVRNFEPPIAVVAVKLQQPGTLRLEGNHEEALWSAARDRALAPVKNGHLSSTVERAWLAVETPGGRTSVKASRIRLEKQPLQVEARFGVPVFVDLATEPDAPHVVVAESMLSQPAVQLVSPGGPPARDLRTMSIGQGFAASLSIDNKNQVAQTWLADGTLPTTDIRLRRFAFSAPKSINLGFGTFDGKIKKDNVLSLALPDGYKKLRLTLTDGVMAAAINGSSVASAHHGGAGTWVENFETTDSRLLVFGIKNGGWALEVIPSNNRPSQLAIGAPFEKRATRAGYLRIDVAAEENSDRWLSVAGTADGATFLGDDGLVRRGRLAKIGATGGTLLIKAQPGLVLAWLGTGDDTVAALWANTDPLDPIKTMVPAQVELQGRLSSLRIESHEDALLHLISGGPGLFRITTKSGEHNWLLTSSGEKHFLASAGSVQIVVRSLAQAQLGHTLHLVLAPLTRIGEGLGPEYLLGPGDGRAFRFTVTEKDSIGVGVRADPDTVRCELVNTAGEKIGDGVVQMHELQAGDYFLLVRAPIDGAGVNIRPAIVGIERPSSGPPEDIIRGYVDREGSGS